MKTVAELQTEREQVLAQAGALLDAADEGDRALTEEEEVSYNAAVERAETLNTEIARRMKFEAAQRPTFDPPARRGGNTGDVQMDPPDDDPQDAARLRATVRPTDRGARIEIPRAYGKLVAFPKTPEGQMRAYRAGMWLRATLYADANSVDWCRRNGVGIRSALAGGVNTSGGALVPEELERAIIDLREDFGLFRRVCRVAPMGSDTRNIPRRKGGLTAFFVGENTEGTESDASWDNVQLMAKKLMVLTRMSSEISEDAVIDLADQMAEEIAYALAVKEDNVGFVGTGIGSDGGIVGVLVKAINGLHEKAKVAAAATHDQLSEIDATDLISLMSVLPRFAKRGAAWYCSPTAQELVFNAIKIAGGGTTRDMLADADVPRFLGFPIQVTDVMADDAAATFNGQVMVAFGNLRQAATLGDRRGIRVALSSERYWSEDQIGIKGTERFDINVHDLGSNTEKSPFAVLVGTT